MKNKKLLKALAAITMGAVMAVGSFSLAACGGKKPNDNPDQDQTQTGGNENDGNENENKPAALTFADYVAKGADDINDDTSVPTYPDESGTPAQIEAPKVVAKTGDGAALVAGTIDTVSEFAATDRDAGTLSEEWTDGVFAIGVKTEVRGRNRTGAYVGETSVESGFNASKSVKLNGDTAKFIVKAAAAGTLVLYVENGSSSAGATQTLVMTKPGGSTQNIDYPSSKLQRVSVELEAKGEYYFMCGGTTDVYAAKFTTSVVNTAIESISLVDKGTVDYFVGQQLDCTGIVVTATHKTTGMVSAVNNANLELDTSEYDGTKAGTYEIGVSYTVAGNLDDATTTFTTSYNVNVYAYDSLELGFNKTVKEANNAAGNQVYANHAVKQFYFKGEAFDGEGLSVKGIGKFNESKKTFMLDQTKAVISAVDTSTVGKKTVKVAYTVNGLTKAKGFNVYVAEKPAELATANTILLAVNPQFSTATIGTKNAAGAYRFKTIQQAIDFLNASGAKASAEKIVYIAEGTYWEKLEVTVPNVTFVGAGTEKTKIEFDSLYGIPDESGYEQITDSTATLNVRYNAAGFKIENVTISNAYNSLAYFNEKLGVDYKEHRALAMLIQADKVVVENCKILGYQDTIELFKGRQLFIDTYISGTTDFIFGTNNTTYFYNCQIHSITTGKKDGGYVTAFKGCSKDANDAVTYGAIFDKCNFTADADVVTNGNTAIGRPWGAYAAVAVINSNLAGHISKKAASGASKNERYVAMSSVAPTVSTVKFVEYNNTGAGAITAAVAGMKMLSATEAANYSNLAVIFGKTNGKVTYSDAWDITL